MKSSWETPLTGLLVVSRAFLHFCLCCLCCGCCPPHLPPGAILLHRFSLPPPNCFPEHFMVILTVCTFSPNRIRFSAFLCFSVFYVSLLVTVLVGKRWLQMMTCDFQASAEQGNFKQHGLLLGAVPFRAPVSIMAFRGTSPLCLFTLGKPSMPLAGIKPSKFPLLAMAQRSFILVLGKLH